MKKGLDADLFELIARASEPLIDLQLSAVITSDGGVIIVRPDEGLLSGMWCLPGGGPLKSDTMPITQMLRAHLAVQLGTVLTDRHGSLMSISQNVLRGAGGSCKNYMELHFLFGWMDIHPRGGPGIDAWKFADAGELRRMQGERGTRFAPGCLRAIDSALGWQAEMPHAPTRARKRK